MDQKAETPSLEQAVERLEGLVNEMETSQLPLETLITRYEEGLRLVKLCQEKLDAAEQRIQIITRDVRGKTTLENYSTGQDEE